MASAKQKIIIVIWNNRPPKKSQSQKWKMRLLIKNFRNTEDHKETITAIWQQSALHRRNGQVSEHTNLPQIKVWINKKYVPSSNKIKLINTNLPSRIKLLHYLVLTNIKEQYKFSSK